MQGIIRENKVNGERKAWEDYGSTLQPGFMLSNEKSNGHFTKNIYNETNNRTNFHEMQSQKHKISPMNDIWKPQIHSINQLKPNFPSAPNNISYSRDIYGSPSFSKHETPFKSGQRFQVTTNQNSPKSQETSSCSQSQFFSEKKLNANSNKVIQQFTGLNEMSLFEKHDNQKKKYEALLLEKNTRINKLVEKLTDQSKKSIQEEASSFLQSVLNANAQLQNQLCIQINKNKQNVRAIEELQAQNLQLKGKCEKLQNSKMTLEKDLEKIVLKDEQKMDGNSSNYFLVEGLKRKIKQLQLCLITMSEDYQKLKTKNISSQDYFNNELRQGLEKLKNQKIQSHQSFLKLSHSISNKEIQINLLKIKLQGYDRKIQSINQEMVLKTKLIEKIGSNMKALLDDEGKKQIMLAMQEVLSKFKAIDQQKRDYQKQIEDLNNKIQLLTL